MIARGPASTYALGPRSVERAALSLLPASKNQHNNGHPLLALTNVGEEAVYELIERLCPLKVHRVATLWYEIHLGCRHEPGKHLRQEEWVSGILAANDEKSRCGYAAQYVRRTRRYRPQARAQLLAIKCGT